MKTIIIGLGNPFLTDDSVGIRVSQKLKEKINCDDVKIVEVYAGGIRLLDVLESYDSAIIVDSIKTVNGKPGDIYKLDPEDLESTNNVVSLHDMNLSTALQLGSMVNMYLPSNVKIWGIEGLDFNNFSMELTPEVEKAIPIVVDQIIEEINFEYNLN